MSADSDQRCWGCHQYAPAGVCLGPHEGFGDEAMQRAVSVRDVERPSNHPGIRVTGTLELRRLDDLARAARRGERKRRQMLREWLRRPMAS